MRNGIAIIALAATALLVGCSADEPVEDPPVDPQPSETAEPEPGSAEALLPDFLAALEDVDAASDVPDGEAAVDALVDAGFDLDSIERTDDVDSFGEPVTLLEISVRVDESCLVGQIGQGEATARILPVLASGACLVGVTVPVD